MPTFAGSCRMPYARFLTWNAVGGITWGTTVVLIGYLAGASYERIARRLGEGAAIGSGLVVVVALVVWHLRRGRPRRDGVGAPHTVTRRRYTGRGPLVWNAVEAPCQASSVRSSVTCSAESARSPRFQTSTPVRTSPSSASAHNCVVPFG